jgi:hypothetical protein
VPKPATSLLLTARGLAAVAHLLATCSQRLLEAGRIENPSHAQAA